MEFPQGLGDFPNKMEFVGAAIIKVFFYRDGDIQASVGCLWEISLEIW